MSLQLIDPTLNLWQFAGETNGYLIVRGEKSLLIDCPTTEMRQALQAAGLPAPELVLHTQVQEEHCREWAAFPQARVFVSAASAEVARCSPAFVAGCATVWPPTRDWGDTRGQEEYGIGGCTTERPPAHPLAVAGVPLPGEWFTWEDVTLAVVALPGSGRRALGFAWEAAGLFFSGDSVVGRRISSEPVRPRTRVWHPPRLPRIARLAGAGAGLSPRPPLLPTTGPVIDDPKAAGTALTARLDQLFARLAMPASPTPS